MTHYSLRKSDISALNYFSNSRIIFFHQKQTGKPGKSQEQIKKFAF